MLRLLRGIRASDFVMFYEWETTTFIQKVEINCRDIFWNPLTSQLAITSASQFYLLQYNKDKVRQFLASQKEEVGDEGIDEAFSIDTEISETVVSGIWLKSCFFYLTNQNKLNYILHEKSMNYAFLERPCQILGYLPTQGVLLFVDGAHKITSYEIPTAFYSAISNAAVQDFDSMKSDLEKIENHKFHDRVAKYLEAHDQLEVALEIVKNSEIKFEYALKLEDVEQAYSIAKESGSKNSLKQIGDLCLVKGEFDKAESAFKLAEDLPSLFLMYSSLGEFL